MEEINSQYEETKEISSTQKDTETDDKKQRKNNLKILFENQRKRKSAITKKYGNDLSPTTYKKVK